MKTGCIYRITNLVNGKIYIGKTSESFLKRFRKHLANAKHVRDGSQLGKAIRKYGEENFYIGIIVDKVPIYFLDAFERYWIHHYNSLHAGYNCTVGGDGGSRPWTDKQRQTVSQSRKGVVISAETRAKISNTLKATPMTAEHKAKMTAARSKIPHPMARKVLCVETGQIFPHGKAAADWLGHSSNSNIHNACKGRRPKVGGYTWKYPDE